MRQRLAEDPFSGALFVFHHYRRTAVKLLVYDGQGFWLGQTRLSPGRAHPPARGRPPPVASRHPPPATAGERGQLVSGGLLSPLRRAGMSRHRQKPPRRVQLPIQELEAIIERTRSAALPEAAHAPRKAAVETLAPLTAELESTQTTRARVRRIVFGSPSERTAAVLGEEKTGASLPDAPPPAQAAPETPLAGADSEAGPGTLAASGSETTPPGGKKKRLGHGRNGTEDFPRAPPLTVAHAPLRHGDPCPEPGCGGRLYRQRRAPAVLVRVTGVAPLAAQVYELERLRGGLCGTVFTAEPPAGVGESKDDERAAAMIALLKSGCGLPFHRIQRLEKARAIPLPAATPWEVVPQAAALHSLPRPWPNSPSRLPRAQCSTTTIPRCAS